jgi:L-ribulose-5-phosphate 4-epimerase
MHAQDEGITKFDLAFTPTAPLPETLLRELNAWRRLLWRSRLIGQDPARYGGVGFGNVSRRLPAASRRRGLRFAISGTQTGALAELDANHYAIVTACDPAHNRVEAEGPIAPSSESLTHGMLYRIDASIQFIFHVHSPDIWSARESLNLPTTATDVPYGTPAMAAEIRQLKHDDALMRKRIVAMGGHQDGVISFGRTAEQTGVVLIRTLARAMAIK